MTIFCAKHEITPKAKSVNMCNTQHCIEDVLTIVILDRSMFTGLAIHLSRVSHTRNAVIFWFSTLYFFFKKGVNRELLKCCLFFSKLIGASIVYTFIEIRKRVSIYRISYLLISIHTQRVIQIIFTQ